MEKLLDDKVMIIWENYKYVINKGNNDYLTEAIWGVSRFCELDEDQKNINAEINKEIDKILLYFKRQKIEHDSIHFISFILNSLIVVKLAYMRDISRLRIKNNELNSSMSRDLAHLH